MKAFIFLVVIMSSSLTFAEGTIFIGKTTSIGVENDSLTIISLSGVNLGNTKFKDTIGMNIGFSFGEDTFNKRSYDHNVNTMFHIGWNFPIKNKAYVSASGNIHWSTMNFQDNPPTDWISTDQKVMGFQIGLGTKINDNIVVEGGYNKTINAAYAQIGILWQ